MLAWTIYISFIGVLVLMLLPREAARAARIIALLTAIAGCVVAFAGAMQQPNPGEVATIVKVPWIPAIGASYYLAADGISLVLVVLTGLAAIAGILFSWNIEKRTKEFFAFYLALIGGVYGVFLSFDVLLLFVFYELTIIPKYFLIARWGSTRKEYGAMKLALLFVCRQPSRAHRFDRRVGRGPRANRPRVARFDGIVESVVPAGFPALGVSRWCSSDSRFWRACGRSTRGRPPVTWPRPPPARCCWRVW